MSAWHHSRKKSPKRQPQQTVRQSSGSLDSGEDDPSAQPRYVQPIFARPDDHPQIGSSPQEPHYETRPQRTQPAKLSRLSLLFIDVPLNDHTACASFVQKNPRIWDEDENLSLFSDKAVESFIAGDRDLAYSCLEKCTILRLGNARRDRVSFIKDLIHNDQHAIRSFMEVFDQLKKHCESVATDRARSGKPSQQLQTSRHHQPARQLKDNPRTERQRPQYAALQSQDSHDMTTASPESRPLQLPTSRSTYDQTAEDESQNDRRANNSTQSQSTVPGRHSRTALNDGLRRSKEEINSSHPVSNLDAQPRHPKMDTSGRQQSQLDPERRADAGNLAKTAGQQIATLPYRTGDTRGNAPQTSKSQARANTRQTQQNAPSGEPGPVALIPLNRPPTYVGDGGPKTDARFTAIRPTGWDAYFKLGAVFAILLFSEDTSDDAETERRAIMVEGHRVNVHEVRMVVVGRDKGFAWTIPIQTQVSPFHCFLHDVFDPYLGVRSPEGAVCIANTMASEAAQQVRDQCHYADLRSYRFQGLKKRGLSQNNIEAHAIVHMVDKAPTWLENEPHSTKRAIGVVPADSTHKLHKASRINFQKVHTVELNRRILKIGTVHPNSISFLQSYFEEECKRVRRWPMLDAT